MGSGIATHKELYEGPLMIHGQTMRSDVMHVKGHGHSHGGKSKFATKSRDRFLGKKRFQKKARRMLLQP